MRPDLDRAADADLDRAADWSPVRAHLDVSLQDGGAVLVIDVRGAVLSHQQHDVRQRSEQLVITSARLTEKSEAGVNRTAAELTAAGVDGHCQCKVS